MFDSMFIGLSGMRAYSNGLRQVSNNITNLNSQGYKGSSLIFRDVYGAGGGALGLAGGNSSGGDGVELSLTRLDFSQGELRQSDRALDLAVEGNGFLVLEKNGSYYYTRTGNFEIDGDGFVVLAGTDYRLTALSDTGEAIAVSIASNRLNQPSATTRIQFSDNLSSTAEEFALANLQVFSANGDADTWSAVFTRDDTSPVGEWTVTVTNSDGDEVGVQALKFIAGIVDPSTQELTFADTATGQSVIFDFADNVSSFSSGSVSTLRVSDTDGHGIGDIVNLIVNDTGHLEISYSNEESLDLGAVALADFRDPNLLEQSSGGIFTYNSSNGAQHLSSASERVGRVLSSRIEASNVELSAEFGDLILVQRGYQAASQIVSVSNEMIQQLFAIRGRG